MDIVLNNIAHIPESPDERYGFKCRVSQPARLQNWEMVGESAQTRRIREMICLISKSHASTVLILGESGTGKELVSRAIHYNSCRKDKSFLSINCAAIQESLLESELFGYEKGAFTGAVGSKPGLFETADGGTFCLDEIGDMDLKFQTKLLRFLEDRSLRRVGSVAEKKVDIRIIASTNKNLEQEVIKGRFRRDLYYRLKVISITVPPLRERKEDIPSLVNYFSEEISRKNGHNICMDGDIMDVLMGYNWPGNVRELRNLIESLGILNKYHPIGIGDLPGEVRCSLLNSDSRIFNNSGSFAAEKKRRISDFEREYLVHLLSKNAGNVSKSAREAGMDRGSLLRLMRKHRLFSKDYHE